MRMSKIALGLLGFGLVIASYSAYASEPKEIRISHGGHQILVKDYPGAEPAFVMVHGFPDNHHIYDELAPILSERNRRVVTFDFLGFGDSDKPEAFKYSFEQQLGDLVAVADGLKLKRFVPVAHDAGGPAVINYVLQHPDRTAAIVLLNTYYAKTSTLRLPELIALNADPQLKTLALTIMTDPNQRPWLLRFQNQQFLKNASDVVKQRFNSVLQPIIDANFDGKPGAGPAFIAMTSDLYPNIVSNTSKVASLKTLNVPVTVIWGDEDPYLNTGVAKDLANEFRDAEVHILPLGHWPQIDDPKAVADLMVQTR
jgi:haloalkane dehalogenase